MKGREAAKQRSSEGVRGGGGVAKRGSETIDNISICRRYRRNYGANIYYNSGNVGIGTNAPTCKLQIDNSTTDFAGILFVRNPTNSASQNSQVTCAIAGTSANKAVYTLDVSGSHGWSMYTSGNNTNFNINSTYNCNSLYDRMVITSGGNVGIGNNAPIAPLCIGNSAVIGSDGFLIIGKNSGSGNSRIFRIGYNENYEMCFGDVGSNNTLGTWVQQIKVGISTTAAGSIIIDSSGNVSNYLNSTTWQQRSDHRVKENIKKADLKICFNNIKNINLYRFNYIKGFKQGTQHDKTQLGFIAQQVNLYYPKSITRGKTIIDDNRKIPDLASIDITQVNFTLFGAVKQLIRVVEKQSNRIKRLEEMLNIVADDEVENDADEPYVKIHCEEVDIDSIVPSEPEENISSSNTSNVF